MREYENLPQCGVARHPLATTRGGGPVQRFVVMFYLLAVGRSEPRGGLACVDRRLKFKSDPGRGAARYKGATA